MSSSGSSVGPLIGSLATLKASKAPQRDQLTFSLPPPPSALSVPLSLRRRVRLRPVTPCHEHRTAYRLQAPTSTRPSRPLSCSAPTRTLSLQPHCRARHLMLLPSLLPLSSLFNLSPTSVHPPLSLRLPQSPLPSPYLPPPLSRHSPSLPHLTILTQPPLTQRCRPLSARLPARLRPLASFELLNSMSILSLPSHLPTTSYVVSGQPLSRTQALMRTACTVW